MGAGLASRTPGRLPNARRARSAARRRLSASSTSAWGAREAGRSTSGAWRRS